jgi:hypothetical protein
MPDADHVVNLIPGWTTDFEEKLDSILFHYSRYSNLLKDIAFFASL